MRIFLLALLVALPTTALAHEGHEAPTSVQSIHGGMAQAGDMINMEYVFNKGELKIYPRIHEGDDLKISDLQMVVTFKKPRDKAVPATVTFKDNYFSAKVDFGKAHRIEVQSSVTYKNKTEKFTYQLEK